VKAPGTSIPLAAPYQDISVTASTASDISGKHSREIVRVMNHRSGKGQITDLDYAEAEARAVIDAVTQHRAQQETP
jgi:hypothetical protein